MTCRRPDIDAIIREKRQYAVARLASRLPDVCDILNHDNAMVLARDVPCSAIDKGSQTFVTDGGSGTVVKTTIQRWMVTIPGTTPLPPSRTRFQVVVTMYDGTTVPHVLISTTRVPRGQSGRIFIDIDCEEDFVTPFV
jgi:hypothetical protein